MIHLKCCAHRAEANDDMKRPASSLILKSSLIILVILSSAQILDAEAENPFSSIQIVMDFSAPEALDSPGPDWQHKKFFRTTPMSMTLEENSGYHAIRLETEGSGSIWGRHVDIDLGKTPILAWSWKIESHVEVEDETTTDGDDHPARFFLSFGKPESRGMWGSFRDWVGSIIHGLPYNGRAFEIVWGNNLGEGKLYYIRNFPHYVKRGGKQNINRWWDEEVDLEKLYHQIWPSEKIPHLVFIGLMNDTEIFGKKAVSYFANVRFIGKRK